LGSSNPSESELLLQRLAELKADNHADARARLEAINQTLTPQWHEGMHVRIDRLSRGAASSRSKLPKLYGLMEEFGELRAPHVSCKAGCSTCCERIPVEISDLEAKHIAMVTGRPVAAVSPGRHSRLDFKDTPCPFLVDLRCSIYEHRPYPCRSLASIDRDALTCSSLNTNLTIAKDPRAVPVTMTRMDMFDPLYREINSRAGTAWADIRQFFPTPTHRRAEASHGAHAAGSALEAPHR
jgi:Fe-S-cluster containining protein